MRRRVRAVASLYFFFGGVGEEAITFRVSRVGRGSPKMPPAEQRRRCSHQSLERVSSVFWVYPSVLVLFG